MQITEGIQISSSINFSIRVSLYKRYISTAKLFAKEASMIEKKSICTEEDKDAFFGYAVFSIVSAISALESYVNELFINNKINYNTCKCSKCNGRPNAEKALHYFFETKRNCQYTMSSEVRNIVFLRNEYIHYDSELMLDTAESENLINPDRLQSVLEYFNSK